VTAAERTVADIEDVEEDAERDANDRYNREALVGLLRKAGEKTVALGMGTLRKRRRPGKNKVSTESAWKANQALRRPLIGELFEKDLAELADDAEPDVS
jgi:hypothetical protein